MCDGDTSDDEEEEDDYARFLDEDEEQQLNDSNNGPKTWIARAHRTRSAGEVQPDTATTGLDEEVDEAGTAEPAPFAVFESISHRGKPLAYDISGRPVAFDSPDTRLKATAAAAAVQLCNVTVAHSGDERHNEALKLLRNVWSQSAGSVSQNVELRAGDILLADNSVLVTPHPPLASPAAIVDAVSIDETVHTMMYDEVQVLRSCALDRRHNGSGGVTDRPATRRSHLLWLGLQLDSKNLKWWWW